MNKTELQNKLNVLENQHFKLSVEEGELKEMQIRNRVQNRLSRILSEKKVLESEIRIISSELKNL
ncbi:hypothetical protein [uncultured Aquimarina sp.]|uniref:hypothetical protein n=1 Tax=uncultured Aquimarina sp. TaxID=575652 RepID=UPI0026045358|nr:hypothetical protein [uncultured Aquimarina sp.]